jgi:hypothetical protein
MRTHHKISLAVGMFAVLFALAVPAHAQSKPKRAPKVIQLEEIKIEGRVQKPNAFYILNRSNLGYAVMDLRTSFLREIVRSVNGRAF